MRLVPYIRVSTEEQAAKGHSLGQQLDRIRLWAQVAGHELVDVIIDDGVSGSIPLAKRKGGADLIERLRRGGVDGVAVIRLDRLFRNALDGLRFFEEEIQTIGASVHSLAESIDTSTPSGWLMLIMLLAQADYARRLDVQRGKETNKALRESGKVYGNVPFGCVAAGGESYREDGKKRTRGARLFREPKAWAIRQGIVNLRMWGAWQIDDSACFPLIDGTERRAWSFSEISAWLREHDMRSPEGSRHWSKSTLAGICASHSTLLHLPMLGDDGAQVSAAPGMNHETAVSHVAH